MKRVAGVFLALLLLTGAAACGDDDSDDTTTEATEPGTESDSGDEGDSGDGEEAASGNADVAAYCDAVDEYVAKVEEAMDDPAKAAELASSEGTELTEKATALASAGLSADEAQEVADCTERATAALTGG